MQQPWHIIRIRRTHNQNPEIRRQLRCLRHQNRHKLVKSLGLAPRIDDDDDRAHKGQLMRRMVDEALELFDDGASVAEGFVVLYDAPELLTEVRIQVCQISGDGREE